jgi:signal transduction histidine kinase
VGIALVVCVAPAILFVGFSSYTLSAILGASQHEADTDDVAKEASKTAATALQCRRYEKDALLNCRDRGAQDKYMAHWKEAVEQTSEKLKALSEETAPGAPLADEGAHSRFETMITGLEKYEAGFERLIAEDRATVEQDPATLNGRLGAYKDAVRDIISGCELINQEYTERAMPAEEAVHGALGNLATELMIGTAATAALGIASALVVPRLLTRRVTSLGHFADAVREGNLSARSPVEGKDELGRLSQAINAMLDNLASAVERERASATAEAEARQAGESKMRFMANMSHEIRTPMTAILGFTDLLLDPTLAPETRTAHTETIRRNGHHLLGVINDILDLSKLQAEKMTLSVEPAQVCRLIAEVAAMVRVRAAEKGVPLNVVYEFPMPEFIQTDGLRLRQVLVNLVSNAVKFTEKGSVRLVARADGLGAPKPFITFQVIDTGVGMTQDQLTRLFQPFTQVDDSATRRFGGTGLGLCISKELSERLGGSLSVESRQGEGTTFTLHLPVGTMEGVRLVHNAEEALGGSGAGVACGFDDPPERTHPSGRGRTGQPASDKTGPEQGRGGGRCGGERRTRPQSRAGSQDRWHTVRVDPDGHADAGDGRLQRNVAAARTRIYGRDRGADCARDVARPSTMPAGGVRRLRH